MPYVGCFMLFEIIQSVRAIQAIELFQAAELGRRNLWKIPLVGVHCAECSFQGFPRQELHRVYRAQGSRQAGVTQEFVAWNPQRSRKSGPELNVCAFLVPVFHDLSLERRRRSL